MKKNIEKNRKKEEDIYKYKYHFKICSVKKCMNTAHVFKAIFNFSVKFDTKNILHYCSFKKINSKLKRSSGYDIGLSRDLIL